MKPEFDIIRTVIDAGESQHLVQKLLIRKTIID